MTLNELTNEYAIEAAREEATEVATEATWDEAQKRMSELIDKGFTGDSLKQAMQRERPRVIPQTTRTKSAKRQSR
jgi:SOS response regulatory protein OraA/RecX